MPLAAGPLPYQSRYTASPRTLAPAMRWATFAMAFGGLAGVSCVTLMRQPREWAAAHALILAMAASASWHASLMLRRASSDFPSLVKRDWPILDALAAVAIFMVGLVPWLSTLHHTDVWHWSTGQTALGGMVLVLAVTSLRHRKRYRALAAVFGPAGYPRTAYALDAVGDSRSLFEAAWFCCVALAAIGPAVHWFAPIGGDQLALLTTVAVSACSWICVLIWIAATAVIARAAYVAGACPPCSL